MAKQPARNGWWQVRTVRNESRSRLAVFSDCGTYRYLLAEQFENAYRPNGWLNFLMLNPSTADEFVNDPTVERCSRRARWMGFRGFIITNLFGLRSTDPAGLRQVDDPVGPENDAAILFAARWSAITIVAWGASSLAKQRAQLILPDLRASANELLALKLTKEGCPQHPLYTAYHVVPVQY